MRLAHFRENAPGGFDLAVESVFNSPTFLVEICAGSLDLQRDRRQTGMFRQQEDTKFREVKITVILPSGALFRQAWIVQHFQAKCGDRSPLSASRDEIGILHWRRARAEQ